MNLRLLFWSVRRELWEHGWIRILLLATAGFVFFGFVPVMVGMARPSGMAKLPYDIAISMMLAPTYLAWVFYCLDALHGERRDRSILFWKSMPVSDLTTVLAKAAIPLLVLPAMAFVVTAALQLALVLAHKATGLLVGIPLSAPGPFPLLRTWGVLLYGIVAMTLWLAPVYAWCLFVSAWARRAAFVWALLPFALLRGFEHVVLQSDSLSNRWASWSTEAFASLPRDSALLIDPTNPIAPGKFLASPGLWIGLVLAVLFLLAAARMRRRRSPL
jgi:ABC-2 type transport system permease protein